MLCAEACFGVLGQVLCGQPLDGLLPTGSLKCATFHEYANEVPIVSTFNGALLDFQLLSDNMQALELSEGILGPQLYAQIL